MVVFVKIFLKFDNRFWDDKLSIYIANATQGYYPWWKPIKDSNLMMSIVTGDEAKRIERLDPEEVKDEVYSVLKGVYADATRPTDINVVKWDTDPRFCGSYSFYGTKAFANVEFEDM